MQSLSEALKNYEAARELLLSGGNMKKILENTPDNIFRASLIADVFEKANQSDRKYLLQTLLETEEPFYVAFVLKRIFKHFDASQKDLMSNYIASISESWRKECLISSIFHDTSRQQQQFLFLLIGVMKEQSWQAMAYSSVFKSLDGYQKSVLFNALPSMKESNRAIVIQKIYGDSNNMERSYLFHLAMKIQDEHDMSNTVAAIFKYCDEKQQKDLLKRVSYISTDYRRNYVYKVIGERKEESMQKK